MAKKKYYAVAAGRSCGVFNDWATAEKQVKGFAGARYKSFSTLEEAEAWLAHPVYANKKVLPLPEKDAVLSPKHDAADIIIYTDGGCINNPGPGGYGAVIDNHGRRQEYSGGFRLTTNNRMEMMAAIVALQELGHCREKIVLYSDSSYLVNGINKGWTRKWQSNGWRKSDNGPVINVDLWQKLLALLEGLDAHLHWVKGHAGLELNERCDRLAVSAARQQNLPRDTGYENTIKGL